MDVAPCRRHGRWPCFARPALPWSPRRLAANPLLALFVMGGVTALVLAVALACAASSAFGQLTAGTQSCDLPDFLSEGYGPATSEVNRNEKDPNQVDHRALIKEIDDLRMKYNNYKAWYDAVRG